MYEGNERGMAGEHLNAHYFSQSHNGVQDVKVKITEKTNVACPKQREGFWASFEFKLNSFEPHGLNLKDFFNTGVSLANYYNYYN